MHPEGVLSRPTRAGWIAFGMAFVLAEAGALGGNNLVIAVAVVAWAVLLIDYLAGRRNLAGLEVGWRLPEELFARRGARGAFRIGNPMRTSWALEIGDGCAHVHLPCVPRGEEMLPAAWWRPEERGQLVLEGMVVLSSWPFGLFAHRRRFRRQARCLVYPTPRFDPAWPGRRGTGEGDSGRMPGGAGDLLDIRPYRPGDRLRSLHWRTSARTGSWMVVDRAREEQAGVRIRVDPGREIEAELAAASGAILEATASGAPVSLELAGHPELAHYGTGTRWRRQLLDALAGYPC